MPDQFFSDLRTIHEGSTLPPSYLQHQSQGQSEHGDQEEDYGEYDEDDYTNDGQVTEDDTFSIDPADLHRRPSMSSGYGSGTMPPMQMNGHAHVNGQANGHANGAGQNGVKLNKGVKRNAPDTKTCDNCRRRKVRAFEWT
jgi:hypothetical protein